MSGFQKGFTSVVGDRMRTYRRMVARTVIFALRLERGKTGFGNLSKHSIAETLLPT
jgi:hypothetical protein